MAAADGARGGADVPSMPSSLIHQATAVQHHDIIGLDVPETATTGILLSSPCQGHQAREYHID